MSKKIIIFTSFNNWNQWGESDNRIYTKEWIDQRISIFMNYTLKSLKIQTNQNFLHLIMYDPTTKELIQQALANYDKLPDNIRFVSPNEYHNQISENIKGYDYLYLVRLDSDDMYHKSYIQQLHNYIHNENTKVLINRRGYIYDSANNRLAKYYHFSPQFYTEIYKVNDYQQGKRHGISGHHLRAYNLPYEILKNPNFINHKHTNNTDFDFPKNNKNVNRNIWQGNGNSKCELIGNLYRDKNEIEKILEEFIGPITIG
ncbi:glycosyltransferase [Brassicibacter mesophilus]|uniref:glycosyltransferase n=1 Tax=Brassicibacter mesophilus TaxID=745119 RepID=UPI003D21C80D